MRPVPLRSRPSHTAARTSRSTGTALALGLALIGLEPGCASPSPRPAPRAAAVPPAPTQQPANKPARPRLPPLTGEERALAAELKEDVRELAGEIGERNLEHEWQLASATDYITRQLERAGYEPARKGYAVGDAVVQNIEAEVPGGRRGRQIVLIGAHYDTHPGSPGADDNASGVAALLALSRRLRDHRPSRTLRFVFFANEESPHFQTERMGSLVYAKQAIADGDHIVAMMSLESLGYYSDAPGSQNYPLGLSERYPKTGDFIAVVSDEESSKLFERVYATMKRHSSIPVVGDALDANIPGVSLSDHWAFWQVDVPAVMVTDTAPFRNPAYHTGQDRPESLDYSRMARVVSALDAVLRDLGAQDPPATDGGTAADGAL